jgi:hypothetical protein
MPSIHRNAVFFGKSSVGATMAFAFASLVATVSIEANAENLASWQVVGIQGSLQVVIVPKELAQNASAYQAQVAKLCQPAKTCFVNFYTNSSGVKPELPLPDAIASEATARFRRSTKNGVELFEWSCRLSTKDGQCF